MSMEQVSTNTEVAKHLFGSVLSAIKPTARASVNYVQARFAIEQEIEKVKPQNAARANTLMFDYKRLVIAALEGVVVPNKKSPSGRMVEFTDGSKATW